MWPGARRAWPLIGILSTTLFYILAFLLREESEALFISPLIAIPVILAGWFYGLYWGLLVSGMAIILNGLLYSFTFHEGWMVWMQAAWPGNVMVILVGYIAGRFKRVYERQTFAQAQLRSRERYLALINLAINDVLSFKNTGDKYHFVVSHLANLFVADRAYLIHWDSVQEKAVLVATTEPAEHPLGNAVLSPEETALPASVLRSGLPLVIPDLSKSDYVISSRFLENPAAPAGSLLCIPLTAGEFKFGAVIIVYRQPRRFTSDESKYAELAGSQLGLALQTVQQEIRIQKQLKEAKALTNIERVLSETERVGIETVLQIIVDSAKELIPSSEQAVLHLLDAELQLLIPRAVAGYSDKTKSKLNMHPGEGVAGRVITTGEIVAIPDVQSDPFFLSQSAPVQYRSLVVVPIQTNDRRVGTLSVHSSQVNAFTPEECRLLGALGTQAALAIENASLLETTQQDLKEINALYQLSQGLATSLDPNQLMKDAVSLLQQFFGYYHVQIFVTESQTGDLLAHCGAGAIGNRLAEQEFRLPAGAGIIGHVAETGQPFITNNVDQVIFFSRNPLLLDTQSEASIPIKIGDQVLGVFDIQQTPPGHLTSRDIQLMTAVADQLSVALQKANLYTDLQAALQQEKAVRSQLLQSERLAVAGRLLASVSHELGNPLQALQNALFLLKEEKGISGQGRQDLHTMLEETERMTAMIDRLRSVYRPTRAEDFQHVMVNDIIEDVRALTATLLRHRGINFEFHPERQLPPIVGVPDQMKQVILNLFLNAVDAMKDGGCLTVKTQNLPDQDKILLAVQDTGTGIDPNLLPHIFEPFVTDKETGTGLGLTITYDIIRQHQGQIQAENNPGGGATFKVWLPAITEAGP